MASASHLAAAQVRCLCLSVNPFNSVSIFPQDFNGIVTINPRAEGRQDSDGTLAATFTALDAQPEVDPQPDKEKLGAP